jgi:hypothetical protein
MYSSCQAFRLQPSIANPERRTRKAVSKGYAGTKLTRDSSYSGEDERPTEPRSVE